MCFGLGELLGFGLLRSLLCFFEFDQCFFALLCFSFVGFFVELRLFSCFFGLDLGFDALLGFFSSFVFDFLFFLLGFESFFGRLLCFLTFGFADGLLAFLALSVSESFVTPLQVFLHLLAKLFASVGAFACDGFDGGKCSLLERLDGFTNTSFACEPCTTKCKCSTSLI